MGVLEYLILVLRVIAGRSQGVSYETRDDAACLAVPAAAGPTYRACRAVEGTTSMAPDDTECRCGTCPTVRVRNDRHTP